jgi:hypothetical protein
VIPTNKDKVLKVISGLLKIRTPITRVRKPNINVQIQLSISSLLLNEKMISESPDIIKAIPKTSIMF